MDEQQDIAVGATYWSVGGAEAVERARAAERAARRDVALAEAWLVAAFDDDEALAAGTLLAETRARLLAAQAHAELAWFERLVAYATVAPPAGQPVAGKPFSLPPERWPAGSAAGK